MNEVLATIGNTPLIHLHKSVPPDHAAIYAKLESFNPGGSVKDRICLHMLEAAEARGELKPGTTVIEPTSGNTGIGLAMVCAVKKYPLILVMPENYSVERRHLMREFGAKIELTPAADEMPGAIRRVEELAKEIGDVFLPRQFLNPDNPDAHRKTTAPEILKELAADQIDALVLGVGTGGTLTGVGSVIKSLNPGCQVIAVEPAAAPVLSGGKPGVHRIQGIGAGFIPENVDRGLIDGIETVSDEDAFEHTKRLSKVEGLLMGISSGAAFCAALRVAKRLGAGKNVVTLFPDKGERYFSIEKFFKNGTEAT